MNASATRPTATRTPTSRRGGPSSPSAGRGGLGAAGDRDRRRRRVGGGDRDRVGTGATTRSGSAAYPAPDEAAMAANVAPATWTPLPADRGSAGGRRRQRHGVEHAVAQAVGQRCGLDGRHQGERIGELVGPAPLAQHDVVGDRRRDQRRRRAVPPDHELREVGALGGVGEGDELGAQDDRRPLHHPLAEALRRPRVEAQGVGQRVAVEALAHVEVEQRPVTGLELAQPGPEPRREHVAVGLGLVGRLGDDDLGVEYVAPARPAAPRGAPRRGAGGGRGPGLRGR